MEEAVSNHVDVAECAVVGMLDNLNGQVPLGLICLNNGCNKSNDVVCKEIIDLVRKQIGPVASFKSVVVVSALPKTRSGKILRAIIRKIADNVDWEMPATVDDPSIFKEIIKVIKNLRY